jgi:adenylate cyclase
MHYIYIVYAYTLHALICTRPATSSTDITKDIVRPLSLSSINVLTNPLIHTADKYGLYKVEIIGDAYFCVSGCPDGNPNHAANLVQAGLELIDAVPELQKLANTNFELRVGMHTGPVVGGVVGINNPRYHVFGDAVALANAMESSGQVGRLHVSEAVYKKLKDNNKYMFDPCGEEEISGFGNQVTYFCTNAF